MIGQTNLNEHTKEGTNKRTDRGTNEQMNEGRTDGRMDGIGRMDEQRVDGWTDEQKMEDKEKGGRKLKGQK